MCSEVSRTAEIAEALQNRLDAYKAEKRELGSVSYSCFPLLRDLTRNLGTESRWSNKTSI